MTMVKHHFWKAAGILFMCALGQAIIIGLCAPIVHHPYGTGETTHSTSYLYSIYVALVYILLFGYWLGYLPGIAFFILAVEYIRGKGYFHFIMLGTVIGIGCALPLLLINGDLRHSNGWYALPTARDWFTLPTFPIVGAVYGYFYKRWFEDAEEVEEEDS